MITTVPTVHIYNIKTRRILTKTIDDVRDKKCVDYSEGLERANLNYIKMELRL